MKGWAAWVVMLLWPGFLAGQAARGDERPLVVGTTTVIADMAQNIAGDKLRVVSFMPVGGDPHIYEPVPADAELLARADLIVRNGLRLEGWLDKLIENSGTNAIVVTAGKGVEALQAGDTDHDAPDPHIWGNPLNGIRMCDNIRGGMARLRPRSAGYFQRRFEAYADKLRATDAWIEQQVSAIPEDKRVLITAHDAFQYYGRRYGFRIQAVAGVSTDAEAQAGDIQEVIAVIDNTGVPAVFIESTINPKLMQQLSTDREVIVGGELYADSVGPEGTRAHTYIGMLRHNTTTIVSALLRAGVAQTSDGGVPYMVFALGALLVFGLAFGVVAWRLRPTAGAPRADHYRIETDGLSVFYGEKEPALDTVSVRLTSGRLTGILGGNGSGKTTLIRAILGLIEPARGSVRINGEPVDRFRDRIAYVPQKESIDWEFPATVRDVVRMGRYPGRGVFQRPGPDDDARVDAAMERVGIGHMHRRQIGELSGGQQQRVFLARALAQDAELFFLDEPFTGVDAATEATIMGILRELAEEGKLVAVIHHDLSKVRDYFDALIMLNTGLVAQGLTDDVFTPENQRRCFGGIVGAEKRIHPEEPSL